jgi:Domain of unknown function (DUF4384)
MKGLFIAALLLLVPLLSHADEGPIWVEAVGEALGSEYDPPKEVMERAKNEARRKAIDEAVGTFVRSHTLVSNAQLAEEFTYARVRGRIEKTKIIKEERDTQDPNLYRVRLKAQVSPVFPEEAEGIQIKLDLSKQLLKEGDEVKIYYQTNTDCYVYIFSIASDNSVTLLFPNSINKENLVKANTGQVFPPEDCPIKLRALCLPGFDNKLAEEKVKVIATRRKEVILQGFQEGMFNVYDAKSTGLVSDLARKLNQLDPADWGEALAVYKIER